MKQYMRIPKEFAAVVRNAGQAWGMRFTEVRRIRAYRADKTRASWWEVANGPKQILGWGLTPEDAYVAALFNEAEAKGLLKKIKKGAGSVYSDVQNCRCVTVPIES